MLGRCWLGRLWSGWKRRPKKKFNTETTTPPSQERACWGPRTRRRGEKKLKSQIRILRSNLLNMARTSASILASNEDPEEIRSNPDQAEVDGTALGEGAIGAPASGEVVDGFRAPGCVASIPEILKFLIDRTGYIKQLEEEGTPESLSRIDNLRELVNAAMDSRDRGESLAEFLDHAALVSDVDTYDPRGTVTLMTLHSAKGLEFSLVFLIGMEEGLFPHSRAFNDPDQMEEERRLCYVGMTRAMDALVLSTARYRRRYGTDMPDATVPSRFLEEVPSQLLEEMGTARSSARAGYRDTDYGDRHYSYEDEDQSAPAGAGRRDAGARTKPRSGSYSGPKVQLHRQHCGVLCFTRQKVQPAADTGGEARRRQLFPPRTTRETPKVRRGSGLSAGR